MTQPSHRQPKTSKWDDPRLKPLTGMQQRFVDEYLIDCNATQAALRAGYAKSSVKVHGPKMLSYPHIKHAIDLKMEERSEKTKITAEDVLTELAKIAFGNPADLFDEDGHQIPIQDMTPEQTALIGGMDVISTVTKAGDQETTIKLKRNDKLKALEMVGKHVNINAFNTENALKMASTNGEQYKAVIVFEKVDDEK
jgi:phage terminase small subunit